MGPFSNLFFPQFAKKGFCKKLTQWFNEIPIGKNSFSELLNTIFQEAGIMVEGLLYDRLTNHSLRFLLSIV